MTYGKLKELSKTSRAVGSGVEYETEAVQTKHRIILTQKVDRRLLLTMREQGKQVCEVKLASFGTIANEKIRIESNHPAMQAALKVMIPLTIEFAKGTIQRSQLAAKRDECLAAAGIDVPRSAKTTAALPGRPPAEVAKDAARK